MEKMTVEEAKTRLGCGTNMELAQRLGVTRQAVTHWAKCGHISSKARYEVLMADMDQK